MSTEAGARAAMTTIKVPQPLRQRITGDAAEAGVTAAAFLTGLVDRYERGRRFAQVRRAYEGYEDGSDDDYAALTRDWDRLVSADLDVAADEHSKDV